MQISPVWKFGRASYNEDEGIRNDGKDLTTRKYDYY